MLRRVKMGFSVVIMLAITSCSSHAAKIHDNRRREVNEQNKVLHRGQEHVLRGYRLLQEEQNDEYESVVYELESNSYCERAAAEHQSTSNMTCNCNFFLDGVIRLSCLQNCLYCGGTTSTTSISKSASASSSSCGHFSFLTDFANDDDLHVVGHTRIFHYDESRGGNRNEDILLEQFDCPKIGPCNSCRISVNGDQCNSCSVCGDSAIGVIVDCENIATNSSFDSCLVPPGPGLFEAFSYDIVECAAPPPPVNDYCSDAVTTAPGEVISGTMTGAVLEFDSLPSCVFAGDRGLSGIWYTFVGTGKPLLVSPCSDGESNPFPIILQGSGCHLLNCTEDYSIFLAPCANQNENRLANSVLFLTESNMTYYVYIADLNGAFGTFDLTLTSYEEQVNVQCSEVSNITVDGGPVVSTIEFGKVGGGLTFCSQEQAANFGQAWYQFVAPQDAILRASTCTNSTFGYPPTIAIATGECSVLSCVVESKLNYPHHEVCGSSVEFPVEAGTRYYVVLWRGTGDVMTKTDLDLFQLDLRSLNPPDNDDCANAQTIDVNVNFTATFRDVTLSPEEGETVRGCLDESQFFYTISGGIWYSFVGTGDFVVATSCSNDFSPFLTIYTGACGTLQCVGPITWQSPALCSNYLYGQQSTAILTTKGENYLILVSGSGTISGTFDFSIRTFASVDNYNCTEAVEIVADGQPIVGSTHGAKNDNLIDICRYSSGSPGAWYSLVGTGGLIRAESCLAAIYDPDIVIWVYTTSDCAMPRCALPVVVNNSAVDFHDACYASVYSSSIVWEAKQDQKYYIRVSGKRSGMTLDFCFQVAPYERPTSDDCNDLSLYLVTFDEDLHGPENNGSGGVIETNISVMVVMIMSLWYFVVFW